MKHAILAVAALGSMCVPVLAQERLNDKDVKALVSRVEDGRDKFDNALDNDLKNKVIRGQNGEVDVEHFLNDFQQNIDKVEERLKSNYAASTEVGTLLRQATIIEAFFRQQAPGTKGESEWNRLAADLSTLAGAYGAVFPLSEHATVRRIGDGEVVEAADKISKSASQLKKSLDADLKTNTAVDKPTRDAIILEADDWSKEAKAVKDRVKDGKPSSAEAEKVLTRAGRLQSFIRNNAVPTASGAWPEIGSHVQTLASAYNKSWSTQ